MFKNWIGSKSAIETYGLTRDQLEYALFTGMLQYQDLHYGTIILKNDLEKHLEELKKLPQKIWIFKSEAMKKIQANKQPNRKRNRKGACSLQRSEKPVLQQVNRLQTSYSRHRTKSRTNQKLSKIFRKRKR